MTPKYKKLGNVVYGMPFQDGTFGVKVVRDKVRIYQCEPIFRYRKLGVLEKVKAVL